MMELGTHAAGSAGVEVEETQTPVTLILEGELNLEELRQVGEELFRVCARGQRQVVLDLSQVNHIDYRGIAPLVARAELFRRAGGDVRVSGVSGYLFHIFRAAGAHDAFLFFAEPDNARASFASNSPFAAA